MKRKLVQYEEEEQEEEKNWSTPPANIEIKTDRSTINNHGGDGVKWFRGSEIGKGSFGSVYLANLKEPKSKYSYFPAVMAVKSAEVSVSNTLQKEREVLSNVQGCVNVIHCFGEEITTGNNGEMIYNLLLEHASGGDLCSLINKFRVSGLPIFDVKRYTKSILLGLKYIHDCGYVHCDLKPGNILLVPNSTNSKFFAKIGDLGLAKRATKRTLNGRVFPYFRGTPLYFSPEVVIDNEQEQPSDIWALGCIVLEMLTGKPVWDVKDENSLSHDLLCGIAKVGELPKIPNEIEQDCKDFLKGCFVRNPSFRLTAELLLNHPFVAGLDDDYKDEEDQELEVGLDDGSEYSDQSCFSDDDDDDDDYSYFTEEDSLDAPWFVKKLEVVKEINSIPANTVVQQCTPTFTISGGV